MKILITGSEGFVGRHLWRELQDAGHHVAGMDIVNGRKFDAGVPAHVRSVIKEHGSEVVVHLAAPKATIQTADEPGDDVADVVRDDLAVTTAVAQVCGSLDMKMVYGSSEAIFSTSPADERIGKGTSPTNVNGFVKDWGEQIAYAYLGRNFKSLRFGSIYGPGAQVGPGGPAIVNMLWQALHDEPIPVHAGETDHYLGDAPEAQRSWCYIGDAVRAARLAIEIDSLQSWGAGAYNISRDDDLRKMSEIAELVCVMTNADKSLIRREKVPHWQVLSRVLPSTTIRRLGWEPQVSLFTGMELTLSWLRELDVVEPELATAKASV